MTEALGHDRYLVVGADWGAMISGWLGYAYSDYVVAVHVVSGNAPGLERFPGDEDDDEFASDEQWMIERNKMGDAKIPAQVAIHRQDPQTLAYALADSPIGTAAWLWERRRSWSDCDGDIERALTVRNCAISPRYTG